MSSIANIKNIEQCSFKKKKQYLSLVWPDNPWNMLSTAFLFYNEAPLKTVDTGVNQDIVSGT